jgi:hypothetical protein
MKVVDDLHLKFIYPAPATFSFMWEADRKVSVIPRLMLSFVGIFSWFLSNLSLGETVHDLPNMAVFLPIGVYTRHNPGFLFGIKDVVT